MLTTQSNGWRSELFWSVLLLVVMLLCGWLLAAPLLFLLLCVSILLLRHLLQLIRFERWLKSGGREKVPSAWGLWEPLYYHLQQLNKKNKRHKKKIGKVLNRFRKATTALPDATVLLDERDRIDWFNKPAEQLLGLRKGDQGQPIINLVRAPEFASYLKDGNHNRSTEILSPLSVEITLEIRIVPYGAGLRLLLVRDVTSMHRMARIRSDFIANASHELRTPLTVLVGDLEILNDSNDLSEPLQAGLKRMLDQSTRMRQLIEDLLLLARLESQPSAALHTVKVDWLLNTICGECETLVGERTIELQLESDVDLYGDVHELRSAFTNLIINALKYSPDTASVTVRWRMIDGGGAQLDVIDQGEGIAASHLSKLTERFYRVDTNRSRSLGGTGLGLAIVKHVLTRHDARLNIDSRVGRGSCFSCVFPAGRVHTRSD